MRKARYRTYKTMAGAERYKQSLARRHPDLEFIVITRDFDTYVVAARTKDAGHVLGWCS